MRLLLVVKRRHWCGVLCGMLLLIGAAGCGARGPTKQVETARHLLQMNRAKQAVDTLSKDDSAEGHYLKAVALQTLGENAAARDQINEALSIEAYDPKYLGYEAVLELNAGKQEAAKTLIELYEQHRSSAALAFFVVRAYAAKGDVKETLRSFRLSLTLIDEIPEFMFSALQRAVTTEQKDICKELLTKLEQAAPKDAEFLRELMNIAVKANQPERAEHLLKQVTALTPDAQDLPELRVKMDLLLGRYEQALVAAHEVAKNAPNQVGSQMLLAEALLRANPSAENEAELAALSAKYPDEPDFLKRYALYLTRVERIRDSVTVLNQRLAQIQNPIVKAQLLNLAIRIPVEAADAALAQQQLELHRASFTNSLVADYFQGRILYIKGDIPGALATFEKVTASAKAEQSDADQLILAESLAWQRRIIEAQQSRQKLQDAQAELRKLLQEKNPKPNQKPVAPKVDKKSAGKSGPK